MKTLYFDCFSGISGDMCLGALIDAGADMSVIESHLRGLPLRHWELTASRDRSRGVSGTRIVVKVDEIHQPHRHFGEIRDLILGSSLPPRPRDLSVKIFERLAEAEGKVHGVPPENVHFHEVGAVDSIVDIVGASLAIDNLDIGRVTCSPVPPGSGTVKCRHGILPVPAPATAELLRGIPLRSLDVGCELTTPTGAAIASVLSESFGPMPEMNVESVGYGLGSRDIGIPNFLRVFLGSAPEKEHMNSDVVTVMETSVDDMNPEYLGYVMEKLFAGGALDVAVAPVQMKKNRPGFHLTVLCSPGLRDSLAGVLFSETTTLGIRFRDEKRLVLDRREDTVLTPFGPVRIKTALGRDGLVKSSPEYEDCRRIAAEKGVPLREVYQAALLAAGNLKR